LVEDYPETAIIELGLLNGHLLDEVNIMFAKRMFFETFITSTNQDVCSNALRNLRIAIGLRIKKFPNQANAGY